MYPLTEPVTLRYERNTSMWNWISEGIKSDCSALSHICFSPCHQCLNQWDSAVQNESSTLRFRSLFFAGDKLQVQQNFQVEAPDVPSAVSNFVNPGLPLQELIYFSSVTSYERVLGLFLEFTKELILRITEVLKSAPALFIESTFHTVGISTALVEKQKTPSPDLCTWEVEILNTSCCWTECRLLLPVWMMSPEMLLAWVTVLSAAL